MPGLLPEEVKKSVQQKLTQTLEHPVTLTFFTAESECQFCKQTHQLLDEITALSDKLSLEVHQFDSDKEHATAFGIDKIPAIAIAAGEDRGIRIYGMPAGYEFTTLIETIALVSTGDADLKQESIAKLRNIENPVHIQVFVTNACPYCAPTVQLAHKIAYVSKHVRADGINAMEFIPLAKQYNVSSVPKVIINEKVEFVGALHEKAFVDQVLSAIDSKEHKDKK
jgi:glutaredoxin-like protein